MKLVFTTSGTDLNAPLESRFGRAQKFLVYNLSNESFEVIENQQNLNAPQGAGIQAAEVVCRTGASGLVTGHCGPKAFRVLSSAHVRVFTTNAPTVAVALKEYLSGKLSELHSGDVVGHWA